MFFNVQEKFMTSDLYDVKVRQQSVRYINHAIMRKSYLSLYIEFCTGKYKNQTLPFYLGTLYYSRINAMCN